MIQSKTVETFLSKVHEALGDMPISEKSDIIVDLYETIENRARHESKSIATIISEMGTPAQVAEEIRKDPTFYHLPPRARPIIVSIFRWLTISIAVIALLIFLTLGAILWKFTPVVKFNEKGMSLFGGAIQMKGRSDIFECPIPDYRGKGKDIVDPKKDPTNVPGKIHRTNPGTVVEL